MKVILKTIWGDGTDLKAVLYHYKDKKRYHIDIYNKDELLETRTYNKISTAVDDLMKIQREF